MLTGVGALVGGCASGAIVPDPVYFPRAQAPARVVHLKSFNRIADLVAIEPTFVEWIRGEQAIAHVGSPAGIDARGDEVYICDTEQAVVHVWNLLTGDARRVGQAERLRLLTPVDVAVAEDGTIYVADTGRGEVVGYDPSGTPTVRLPAAPAAPLRPVALAASGSRLYVADLESASILVFTLPAGALSAKFPLSDKTGDAVMPLGVAVGLEGQVLVSDGMGGRVLVLSPDGELLGTISRRGDRYGDLGYPKHLDVADDGTILIADAEFAHLHLFNGNGQLLMLVGGPEDHTGGTPMPLGMCVTSLSPSFAKLVPDGFAAEYLFFVTNTVGAKRMSLFAAGRSE